MRAACQGSITASVSWFLSLRMTGIGCRSRESSDEDNVQFPRFQCGEAFGSKPGAPEIGAEDVCRRTTDGRRRGGCGLDNASWNALRALSLLHIAPAYEEGFESFCSVFWIYALSNRNSTHIGMSRLLRLLPLSKRDLALVYEL